LQDNFCRLFVRLLGAKPLVAAEFRDQRDHSRVDPRHQPIGFLALVTGEQPAGAATRALRLLILAWWWRPKGSLQLAGGGLLRPLGGVSGSPGDWTMTDRPLPPPTEAAIFETGNLASTVRARREFTSAQRAAIVSALTSAPPDPRVAATGEFPTQTSQLRLDSGALRIGRHSARQAQTNHPGTEAPAKGTGRQVPHGFSRSASLPAGM
jgi:hypothetical protein